MLAGKLLLSVVAVLIDTWLFGLFGPGPLIPGLGPMFDQLPAILFGCSLLLCVAWLVRKSMPRSTSNSAVEGGTKAEEILRERYARGEVNRDEFHRIAEDLCSRSPQHL